VAGSWRRPRNEELYNLHYSPNIVGMTKSKRVRWAGHISRIGEMKNAYKILVGRRERKRSLGGSRRRL